ncbi:tetratricopeptide repeat-containing sulfotransferase family protein [Sphingomonas sp. GC_Shp_3]|uniref:tetratricopeptide repeat-containing sulfotransferase family protein n=1 Tax=Sphingomonas sp. GC_Shp_3 TaxID=2937383 RepID=UPI00226AB147
MADTHIVPPLEFRRAAQATLRTCEQNPIAALRSARALVKACPDVPAAVRLLAFVLRKANRTREADEADEAAVQASSATPAMLAVHDALAAGQLEQAEVLVRQHLRVDPEDAYAAKLLADIAVRCGAVPEGETFYKRALLLAPGYHEARLALALLFSRSNREADAFAAVDHVLARAATHAKALSVKAGLLSHGRRLDEADRLFRKLVAAHPRDPVAWINYAYLLKTLNRTAESIAAYRKAIAFDKANGLAWFGLANLKTVRFDAADIAAMEDALTRPGATDEQRLHLHFALGKAYDDQRDYDAAFGQYRTGNALRRARTPYDAEIVSAEVSTVERVFTQPLIAARNGAGAPDPDPIFIVSLPRSGSTLIEQILASHPLVEGTEELYEIEAIARSLTRNVAPSAWLEEIAKLPPATLHALGRQYIENTRKHRTTDRPYFTDKMPSNWRFTGLIQLILPNAKIVDIRRHPLGCGFANFAQHFNWGIDFSYDLADIGRFYSDYVRHMAHFDAVTPGRIQRVFYETLVDRFEPEVRRLLDSLGLPFDPACLAFYENTRPVHTPSAEQVRQPIYRAGVERWQHYAAYLGPLRDALGPVLDLYPDVPTRW